MTITTVDRHHWIHTCTGQPVITTTRVVHTADSGPCHTPVTIRAGHITTTIDCRRVLPAEQQCPACRHIVVTRHITETPIACDYLRKAQMPAPARLPEGNR